MSPLFQADADLHYDIVLGVLRREPALNFQSAQECLRDGTPDGELLRIAAIEGRILVSHDVSTMPSEFRRFLASQNYSPGVILLPKTVSIGTAIEDLVLLWAASTPEDWRNHLANARRKIQYPRPSPPRHTPPLPPVLRKRFEQILYQTCDHEN